jgi:hypothetical protein
MIPLYIITENPIALLFRYCKIIKLYIRIWNRILYFQHMQAVRLLANIALLNILAHTVACFFYLTARLDEFGCDTWVYRMDLVSESTMDLYITAYYYTVENLTTVVYGDVV